MTTIPNRRAARSKEKSSSSIRLLSRGKQSAMHIAVELQDKEWLDGWIG